MSVTNKVFLAFCIYGIFFMAAVIGVALWRVKRRKEKPPLEFKLLRGPGETLRRRMVKFDEDMAQNLIWAMIAPVVAALVVSWPLWKIFPPKTMKEVYVIVGISGLAFAVVLVPSITWCVRGLNRYRNDRLGYLGERAVGEALEPLMSLGYRVFHDVPAEVDKKKFNVDHVVIGTNGIFVLETKTRRKGRARPGFEAHKVAYDGQQLIWPWAEDNFGLQQAEGRARWLSEWITKMTGVTVPAKPLLVLPGWYVVPKGVGVVGVLNHKQVHGVITRGRGEVLSAAQIDLIARQLDNLCRDVED